MDPKAALDAAERAIENMEELLEESGLLFEAQDMAFEAQEYLDNYASWRSRGGFQPKGGDRKAKDLRNRLHRTFSEGDLYKQQLGLEDNPGPAINLKRKLMR